MRLSRRRFMVATLALGTLSVFSGCQRGTETRSDGVGSAGSGGAPTRQGGPSRGAATVAPSARTSPLPASPNYLTTQGARLVDASGRQVTLTGVNWFGMETGTFAPHGLWARSWQDLLDQVVALGFNALRLPYSNELFATASVPNGIDFSKNPDLLGLSGVEILDRIIVGAGARGLKVILDRHRPDSQAQSPLWYTDRVSEERWIADWVMLAQRYRGNDAVVGADLHNEPRSPATWGSGDQKTDWRLAAERAGNAILEVNPDWLIIVEGIDRVGDDHYWWGGNLKAARDHPVRLRVPNKLVYSAHDYGPGVFDQGWFHDPAFPANLPAIWREKWFYLHEEGIAPVFLGEFGGRSVSERDREGVWQRTLVDFLRRHGISYAYWCLNPNSGDTGGVLEDDWESVDVAKRELLATFQAPPIPVLQPEVVHAQFGPPPGLAKVPPRLEAQVRLRRDGRPADRIEPVFRLQNLGERPEFLKEISLRYWFAVDGDVVVESVRAVELPDERLQAEVRPHGGGRVLVLAFPPQSPRLLHPGGSVDIAVTLRSRSGAPFATPEPVASSSADALVSTRGVGVYLGNHLVWGEAPADG